MSKEAMKLALEALTATMSTHGFREHIEEAQDKAIKALEEALAKQEQRSVSEQLGEPVAWEKILGAVARGWCHEENANKTMDIELAMAIVKEVKALYTTPQQRKPLTDEQKQELIGHFFAEDWAQKAAEGLLHDYEAKLKEKE